MLRHHRRVRFWREVLPVLSCSQPDDGMLYETYGRNTEKSCLDHHHLAVAYTSTDDRDIFGQFCLFFQSDCSVSLMSLDDLVIDLCFQK
nr:hypothetical protein BgiMline_027842 [Biomphalaria glabrata]